MPTIKPQGYKQQELHASTIITDATTGSTGVAGRHRLKLIAATFILVILMSNTAKAAPRPEVASVMTSEVNRLSTTEKSHHLLS